MGRRERKKHGGAEAIWVLLLLLVLIVIKASFLPKVAPWSPPSGESRQEMASDVDSTKDLVIRSPPSGSASRQETTTGIDSTKEIMAAGHPILSKLTCNLTNRYSDTCKTEGEMRVHGKSGIAYVISASPYHPENSTIKIKPYARKWEQTVLELVREITVRSIPPLAAGDTSNITAPPCSVRHDVPAVVFSTGGYNRNFYHVLTDQIIPLYLTAREYNGHVQLLAADYEPKWIAKYRAFLGALSVYPVVDLDADDAVRCFASGHVGMESHRELGIVPGLSRHGYTMITFRDFLRSAYSMPRITSVTPSGKKQRPRLIMVLRRNSRSLTNEAEALEALTGLGFEVIAAGPEFFSDMDRVAATVKSCDVLAGVHGAGLTNMVFLPHNATVVQIIPYGKMTYPCRHTYGDPVAPMGLRYVEYEATEEETTLKYKYPKDHVVFIDPDAIHRQGFDEVWNLFINGQDIILDINRFTEAMRQVYHSITTE